MSALAASTARVPGARALVRLQPPSPGLPSRRRAKWHQRRPISARAGEQRDEVPTAAAAGSSGEQQVAGDNAAPSSSSSAPKSSPITPSTKQTLEALDQLLGVQAQPAGQPEPSPQTQPPPQQQPAAAPRAKQMGEPQLTFYDPNEEAEWKHTTRCVLVGVVGGTALLLAMVVPVALLWFIRHGVPLDRLGDVSRLKEGECLELQERMLCRRELDDFRL